jgi:hypothetical protein
LTLLQNNLIYECDPGKQTFRMLDRPGGNPKLRWPNDSYAKIIVDDKKTLDFKKYNAKLLDNIISINNGGKEFSYNIDGNRILTDIDTNKVYNKPNYYFISAYLEEGKTYLIACKGTTKRDEIFFPINVKDSKEFNRAKEIIYKKKPDILTSDDDNKLTGLISSLSDKSYAWLMWQLYWKYVIPYHNMKPEMAIPSEFLK